MLNKFNKATNSNLFTKDTSNYSDYKKISELPLDEKIPVFGFYLNKKSRYGDHYVAIADGYYINLPKNLNEVVADIMEECKTNTELVKSLNDGNESIIIRKVYSEKWQKDINVVDFV